MAVYMKFLVAFPLEKSSEEWHLVDISPCTIRNSDSAYTGQTIYSSTWTPPSVKPKKINNLLRVCSIWIFSLLLIPHISYSCVG